MIIHEAVFVAKVLGHIQVSFTLFYIITSALSRSPMQRNIFFFKFIRRLYQLLFANITSKILTTVLINYMYGQGVLCTELHLYLSTESVGK